MMDEPRKEATLLFARRDDEILLIRKLRGLGRGLWNAPGGHVEVGETPEYAAIREFEEEVRCYPGTVESRGVIDFYMPDDSFSMRGFIFVTDDVKGEPQETEEGIPRWWKIDEIPYGEMWMDDRIWLPHVLDGKTVTGCFTMIEGKITSCELNWE